MNKWISYKLWILGIRQIIFQRQIGQKYFVQNGRRQEWTRDFDPPFLDIFLDIYKCPFCPLRAVNFKTWNANTQKMGLWPLCSQNAFLTLKNCDWTFLRDRWPRSNQRVKIGHFCIGYKKIQKNIRRYRQRKCRSIFTAKNVISNAVNRVFSTSI